MRIKTLLRLMILLLPFSSVIAQYGSAVTFSEIMFYPDEANGEFVEIYNTSASETIDLMNFKFKYYTSSNNSLVSVRGGTLLEPGKYAVILQGNYDFTSGIYKNLIPPEVIVLKTSSNNFGSSGMANATNRAVYLLNAAGQTIDTYNYSADNSGGFSDEKILMGKDNSNSNWKNSIRENGTPGAKNSVSPLTYDLRITFGAIAPAVPKAGDSVTVTIIVKNLGRSDAANFSIGLFADINNDSVGQTEEQKLFTTFACLAVDDSIVIQKNIYTAESGYYFYLSSIDFALDEDLTNNSAYLRFNVTEKPVALNEIAINEIMYAPVNDEPEWIELYNNSDKILNLLNCKIGDNTSLVTISSQNYYLDPGEYLVIAGDSAILNTHPIQLKLLIKALPAFNNSGDDVRIKNSFNDIIDSLRYSP